MSSPRPVAPSSETPATSVEKRMQRVHWMQRFIERLDQRADIFVLDRALVFLEARVVDAISHGLVLQIALAALIADRAIQRMVDQQEFHHAFARLAHHRRLGVEDLRRAVLVRRQIAHAHGAGRHRLRHPDDLDQAHAAIAGDRQPLVVAEARNLRARRFARLQQRVLRRNVDLCAVNDDLGHSLRPNALLPSAPTGALYDRPGYLSDPACD